MISLEDRFFFEYLFKIPRVHNYIDRSEKWPRKIEFRKNIHLNILQKKYFISEYFFFFLEFN